jgi:NAD(P)-dependent dehydrogenase (short-subunit alcohol dehydrogenase family)
VPNLYHDRISIREELSTSVAPFHMILLPRPYNTVQAGLVHLTRVTAVEYPADGIRANCVCPGAIDTPLLRCGLAAAWRGQRRAAANR